MRDCVLVQLNLKQLDEVPLFFFLTFCFFSKITHLVMDSPTQIW